MAFKEKRREERFSVDIMCTVLDDNNVRVLDISRHGIGLLGDVKLIEGKAVDLTINLDGEDMPIRGVVMNASEYNGQNRYGLEIVSHPETWLDLIYRHMLNNK